MTHSDPGTVPGATRRAWLDRHFTGAAVAAGAALLALAWLNRFMQDDAFIIFRYADHFARGLGLVYNPGERVEGYTCFLYTVLISTGMRLGAEPVALSFAIGLAAYAGSLAGTLRLALVAGGDRRVALLAMALAGTCYSFSAYATGGLETSLETCLVTWALALGVEEALAPRANLGRRAAFSSLAGLAMLTRLDASLLLASVGAWQLLPPRAPSAAPVAISAPAGAAPHAGADAPPAAGPRALPRLATLAIPTLLMVGAWLAWKKSYYGDLLPATFYAKAGEGQSFGQGLLYFYRFVTSYWLAGPLLFAAWGARAVLAGAPVRVLLVPLALIAAYVLRLGGDFMEFRLLVPAIPIGALLLARTVAWAEARGRLGAPLLALILAGSLHHALVYGRTSHHGNESVQHLSGHLDQGHQNWIGIGRVLRREFGNDLGFILSTTAAGAIPYYSGALTVDQLGLTDPEVVRHGIADPSRMPGHRHMAPMDHLIARGVNLVIGHPQMHHESLPDTIYQEDFPVPPWIAGEARGTPVPPGLRAVEIPIENGWRVVALYLTPRASVDEAIRRGGWRVHPVASRRVGRAS